MPQLARRESERQNGRVGFFMTRKDRDSMIQNVRQTHFTLGSDAPYLHKDEQKIGSVLNPGIKEQLEESQSKAPPDFELPRAKARLLKGVHHFNISHPRAEDGYGYESTAQRYYNADSTFGHGAADAEMHR